MLIMGITSQHSSLFTIFLFLCLLHLSFSNTLSDDLHHPKSFVVLMEKSEKPLVFTSHRQWYTSIIKSLTPSRYPSKILYVYEKVLNGFAASLTHSQAEKLKDIPGILSVLPDETYELDITETHNFLALSNKSGLWPSSNYGDGIIIGVLDTGIWPEHRSFSDEGMPPVPKPWTGFCENWSDFPASSCNRKLIGARAFLAGNYSSNLGRSSLNQTTTKSPRDTNGHGTHTASTAAGAPVTNASFYEYAKGVATGIAPKAHIAVYKVCSDSSCNSVDVLAGMDQAVADGVDVISISISSGTGPYYQDIRAIATFWAMRSGVFVSSSGGNSGPKPQTVNNLSPWVITVGASSINREFPADVILGDNRTFPGASLYAGPFIPASQRYTLVYAGDYGNRFCSFGKFNNKYELFWKIVVCDGGGGVSSYEQGLAVRDVFGRGTIVANGEDFGEELRAEPHTVPATRVGIAAGNEIKKYIKSTKNPTANILFLGKSVVGSGAPAPKVASFSSRGPNPLTPQILKPDIIAPGLNILAGWTQAGGPWASFDPRRVEFNIISGTSMACPHVSGVAALLKKAYPNWSPAAIKSAIMTAASNYDTSGSSIEDLATGKESTPFARGAGHLHPNQALDPGLVYDAGVVDYVRFFCSLGYTEKQISIFFRQQVRPKICDQAYAALGGEVTPGDLNLPSITVVFKKEVETVRYRRTVTNVGSNVDATYVASWSVPPGIQIFVIPNKLEFNASNPTLTYSIFMLSSTGGSPRFGWLDWSDETHHVKSPLSFSWNVNGTSESVASI